MASHEYRLLNPPENGRGRQLWLQHAAGFIIFQDARNYAISQIPEQVDTATRLKIVEGIDDVVYGLMMIFDGVSGSLRNAEYEVALRGIVQLVRNGDHQDRVIESLDLFDGDGMCIGYHAWHRGAFGEDPVAEMK